MAERTFRDRVNGVIDSTVAVLFPVTCPGCDVPLPSDRSLLPICGECGKNFERITPPYCRVCGQAFSGRMSQDFQCSNCTDRKLAFDFAIGSYAAHSLLRQLMHRYKYERNIHLVRLLGQLLEGALDDERIGKDPWILIPVPLHRRRFRTRGFNQAEELCRIVRERNRDQFTIMKALRRVRHTPTQASLNRSQRLSNLRGAFAISRFGKPIEKLKGKRVLLVDDVMTTGATASECARILKKSAEVAEIGVITVLRG